MTGPSLKSLILNRSGVVVPSAYDALTARLCEDAGFPAVHISGFFASAAQLGAPDIGLIGGPEMADVCRRVAAACSVPLFIDGDDGYGGPLQVHRTVRAYDLAGASGVHLEDQTAPKRCGLMAGKTVVPVETMEAKIRAALHARTSEDFVVVARSDARESEGLEGSIARVNAYAKAGADAVIVEGLETLADHQAVMDNVSVPVVGAWSPFLPDDVTVEAIQELGFAMVLFVDGPLAVHKAYGQALASVGGEQPQAHDMLPSLSTYADFNDTVQLGVWRDRERHQDVSS